MTEKVERPLKEETFAERKNVKYYDKRSGFSKQKCKARRIRK